MHKPWLITVLQKIHQQPHHKPNHAVNSWARRQPAQPLPWAWVFRPLSAHKRAYGLANAGPDCCGYYADRALCCLRHYPGQVKAQSGAPPCPRKKGAFPCLVARKLLMPGCYQWI